MIWPAENSDVLLKRKQVRKCCWALQAMIELSDGRNDMVAFSSQNNNKINISNAIWTRFVAVRGKIAPHCVPNDTVS